MRSVSSHKYGINPRELKDGRIKYCWSYFPMAARMEIVIPEDVITVMKLPRGEVERAED